MKISPSRVKTRRSYFLLPIILIGLAWLQEFIDQFVFQGTWNLPSGGASQWWGLFTSPFSHSGLMHLFSNTILFLPLSWLVLTQGLSNYIIVWLCVLIVQIPRIIIWPVASHGISGVIFGLFGYLISISFLELNLKNLFLTILSLIFYGHFILSLIPLNIPEGVSWVSHLAGFIGGVLGAFICKVIII